MRHSRSRQPAANRSSMLVWARSLSDLEQFYPERMASRILGMGDVMTLIEKAQANIDEDKAREMEQKLKKAQFGFDDYLESMASG